MKYKKLKTKISKIMKRTIKQKNNKKLIIFATILFAVMITFILYLKCHTVDIHLNGDSEIHLEYGEQYIEQGATATIRNAFTGSQKGIELNIDGTVNCNILGTYVITYSAGEMLTMSHEKRIVHIQDTTCPVIELKHNDGYFVKAGETYEEEGFIATDNYDGDITSKVKTYEKDGNMYYTVTDSSGNTAVAERKIEYNDLVPPVLTLKGDSEIEISAGKIFEEPGYTAIDEEDGDLTENVSVTGTLDCYIPGTYKLVYEVSDRFGNTAKAERTVTVNAIKQAEQVNPGDKIVYLTFDDGPGPYTQELLDILDRYNVKVTFFTTSANTNYIGMIAKEAAAGHSVAIHTATHDYAYVYSSEQAYFEDLQRQSSVIEAQTGKITKLLRFPGGSSNTVSEKYCPGIMNKLIQAVSGQGYQYFDWNVSSGDAGGNIGSEQVFQNVIQGIQAHNVSIVLQHDIHKFSVDAVERIIVWGLANGYTFLPLDETSPTAHHRN